LSRPSVTMARSPRAMRQGSTMPRPQWCLRTRSGLANAGWPQLRASARRLPALLGGSVASKRGKSALTHVSAAEC
jgi:hypothetical protein